MKEEGRFRGVWKALREKVQQELGHDGCYKLSQVNLTGKAHSTFVSLYVVGLLLCHKQALEADSAD